MSSSTLAAHVKDPSWVLNPIAEVGGVRLALIISSDGILVGASAPEGATVLDDRDRGAMIERVCAAVSALNGASRAAAVEALGADTRTPVSTITVQLDAEPGAQDGTSVGTLMVMPVGGGSNANIAAAFGAMTPMGIIAQAMATQAKKLGEVMSVSSRADGPTS